MNTELNKLENIYTNGKSIFVENSSTENPFFFSSTIEEKEYSKTQNPILEKDKEIFNYLPKELRVLYSRIGSNTEYSHQCGFKFLKLDEINRRSKSHTHFIDIAISYAGMGFVNVLSYHEDSKKYFVRMDGGSNDFDRNYNFRKYKNYNPSETELLTLNEVLKSI